MILSGAQRRIVSYDGNTLISSVPGAGKTRIVQAKAVREAARLMDSPFRVACLTYTNTAVAELERRILPSLRESARDRVLIGTLHSFFINDIISASSARVPELAGRCSVVTPEHAEAEHIIEQIRGHEPSDQELRWFAEVRRKLDGTPHAHKNLSAEVIAQYWEMLLDGGHIDLAGVPYYANMILERLPDVAQALGAGFSWIIIDEYQDTSDFQLLILDRIAKCSLNTKWMLIGDFNQSIFGFNGVTRSALEAFGGRIDAKLPILRGSYRCPPLIVEQANRLIDRPRMVAKYAAPTESVVHLIGEPQQTVGDFVQMILERKIALAKAAIIAPANWVLMKAVQPLNSLGIAWRPQFRIQGETLVAKAVFSILAYAHHEASEHLDEAVSDVATLLKSIRLRFDDDKLLETVVRLRQRLLGKLDKLMFVEAVEEVGSLLAENSPPYATRRLDDALRLALRPSLLRETPLEVWHASTLARRVCQHDALSLATIHGAKGMEFEGVMFLGFEKGVIPHRNADDPAEEVRKAYVTITRSSRVLVYGTRAYRESSLLAVALGLN